MVDLKKFFKVGKHYISYLMKLGFKDLFVNFIELVILVGLALLVYIPIGLVRDLLYKIMVFFLSGSTTLYFVFDLVFTIISIVVCLCCFIYLFNKRYEDVENLRSSRKDNLYTNTDNKNKIQEDSFKVRDTDVKEEFDLPKAKEEKKRFH